MTSQKAAMAFVMDPIEKVDIEADTSFALMLEGQRRGHRIYYVRPGDLGIDGARVTAIARRASLRREVGRHVDLEPPRQVVVDEEFDVVFQREDPPVDADYVTATQILSLCRRALVLNRPEGILAANEKLYALHFPDLMPETRVAREIPKLLDFMTKMGGEMIVKPLHGKGGEGIFHVRQDDRNLFSILEVSTDFGNRWTMAQRYVPGVREGDKRILLVEGEPLGAVLRVPAEDETRSNLHVGGRPAKAVVDEHDRRIIERIAPRLRQDGLFFVGIDVIGHLLTEVNVTSPTGLQEMNVLDGAHYEQTFFDRVEALLEGGAGAES
jgi:glutathione synthase